MSAHYFLRPKAVQDLDDQALYFAQQAGLEAGQRFLLAAHDTFSLLATQPKMGWRSHLRNPELTKLRVFRIAGFPDILVLYLPLAEGVDILRIVHGSRDLRALLLREGFLA